MEEMEILDIVINDENPMEKVGIQEQGGNE